MTIDISRQNIYLLFLSVFLFLFVFIFAFALLIPEGKEYRNLRAKLQKENATFKKFDNFRNDVLEKLTELKSENVNIIKAFDAKFSPTRFQKQHKSYFSSLTISPIKEMGTEKEFSVYEVQTTSQINSPTSFYDFLDAVNKSDWIISINFPISFKREDEMITSSFTMKVYSIEQK